MKIAISKKFLSILGVLLTLLFTANNMAYAYSNPKEENSKKHELVFTDETQSKIDLVQSLVTKGGIEIINGTYNIISDSPEISNLDIDTKYKINEDVNFFNEGISLGIFEINKKNYVVPSLNYTKVEPQNKKETGIVTPMIVILDDIDTTFINNGNTMLRVCYMNVSSYGSLIGMEQTGEFFASQVRTGGPWDYKQVYGPTTLYSCYIDGKYVTMSGADIGNANYGYAGRKVFGADLLRSAAGAYQIYSGTSYIGWYNSYFDDPEDQYWINRGISYSEGNGF